LRMWTLSFRVAEVSRLYPALQSRSIVSACVCDIAYSDNPAASRAFRPVSKGRSRFSFPAAISNR
jgi:hypothetical protein